MFLLIVFNILLCLSSLGAGALHFSEELEVPHGIAVHNAPIKKRDVGNSCPTGFKWNLATQNCEDINECQLPRPPCLRYLCENTIGGYKCAGKSHNYAGQEQNQEELPDIVCQEGTRLSSGGSTCEDIDECREGTHLCDQFENCINTYGGHECRCKHGFERDSLSRSCVDIDECAQKKNVCTDGLQCQNLLGSFTCIVPVTTTTTLSPNEDYDSNEDQNVWSCFDGYEKDDTGNCVDINECALNEDNCTDGLLCENLPGSFTCIRATPTTTPRTITTTTPRAITTTTPRAMTTTTPCASTTTPRARTTTTPRAITTTTPRAMTTTTPRAITTSPLYDNENNSVTDANCAGNEKDAYGNCRGPGVSSITPRPAGPTYENGNEGTAIHYGQRGPYSRPPIYDRSHYASCPTGYMLTPGMQCVDIDECASYSSPCGPTQRCENFYGGYTCRWCDDGYRRPCFDENCFDTSCIDVDECKETPGVCSHGCVNTLGSYRCECPRGYRLAEDYKTCVDVNECEEFGLFGSGNKLCGGECVNEPGSYRCSCPAGYRLAPDMRSCIDIDECATGEAWCAHKNTDAGYVCTNTHGSYYCHHIDCPTGYRLDTKQRCVREQKNCQFGGWACPRSQQPSVICHKFFEFVANVSLPFGKVVLYKMVSPYQSWLNAFAESSCQLSLVRVQAAPGVEPADLSCFSFRTRGNLNECVVWLECSLPGPQVVELEFTRTITSGSTIRGSTVVRLFVIISQYEF